MGVQIHILNYCVKKWENYPQETKYMELQHFSSMTFIKWKIHVSATGTFCSSWHFMFWGVGEGAQYNESDSLLFSHKQSLGFKHFIRKTHRQDQHQIDHTPKKKYITRNGQNALGYRYRSICSWFRCVAWVLKLYVGDRNLRIAKRTDWGFKDKMRGTYIVSYCSVFQI